jgi:hypothetical protein
MDPEIPEVDNFIGELVDLCHHLHEKAPTYDERVARCTPTRAPERYVVTESDTLFAFCGPGSRSRRRSRGF